MLTQSLVHWPTWVHRTSQVSHLLTVFSSSANFYIYLAKHGLREIGIARAVRAPDSLDLVRIKIKNGVYSFSHKCCFYEGIVPSVLF